MKPTNNNRSNYSAGLPDKKTEAGASARPHATGLADGDQQYRAGCPLPGKSDRSTKTGYGAALVVLRAGYNESRGVSGLFPHSSSLAWLNLAARAICDRLSRLPDIRPVNFVIQPFAGNANRALDLRAVPGGYDLLTLPSLNDPITRYLEYARHIGQRLESPNGLFKRSVLDWGFGFRVHGTKSILVKLAVQGVSLENPAVTLDNLADRIRL